MIAEQYLSDEAIENLEKGIELAELNTSAEIRVHIEDECSEFVLDRATYIFSKLEMHKTALRNGILIYVAFKNRKLAVIGDAGIHSYVGDSFWNDVKETVAEYFRSGRFEHGLLKGIEMAGEKIKVHFPVQKDDKNELSNRITGKSDIN